MKLQPQNEESETLYEVESEGMMQRSGQWVPIDCIVKVERETEKAYYGNVTVFECDDWGRFDIIFERETWIPKSMSDNPWWITTKLFDYSGKVSNRRFDDYD